MHTSALNFEHVCAYAALGSYELPVSTWRPAGSRILDKMKRFFVGGAPEIDDISYVAVPKDFKVLHTPCPNYH